MCATFPSSRSGSEGRVSWRSITSEATPSGYRCRLAKENARHDIRVATTWRPDLGRMRPMPGFARKIGETESSSIRRQPTKRRIAAGVNERTIGLKVDRQPLFMPRQARTSSWRRTGIGRHLPDGVIGSSAVLSAQLNLHVDVAIAVTAKVEACGRRSGHHRSQIVGDTRRHRDPVHRRERRMRNNGVATRTRRRRCCWRRRRCGR